MDKDIVFKDAFVDALDPEWEWLREDPSAWEITGGKLRIRELPGSLWGTRNDARNILLRPARPFVHGLSNEVTITNHPVIRGEQGGLIWFVNEANYVKLVKEYLDNTVWIVLAREENDEGAIMNRIPFSGDTAQLRLSFSNGAMAGEVRSTDGDEWQTVGVCAPSIAAEVRLGICIHGGPENEAHWAEISNFVIHS